MSLPSVLRVFFAIPIPADFKKKLARYILELQKQSKTHTISWSRGHHLHITLQFLAEIRTEDIPSLVESVRTSIKTNPYSFIITLGELHFFPNPFRPRVIVLNITPTEAINALADSVGKGIAHIHYPIDHRPFKAHLTLGRIKKAPHLHLDFLEQVKKPDFGEFLVNEVILFRSEPQENGSKYTEMDKIYLIQASP